MTTYRTNFQNKENEQWQSIAWTGRDAEQKARDAARFQANVLKAYNVNWQTVDPYSIKEQLTWVRKNGQ